MNDDHNLPDQASSKKCVHDPVLEEIEFLFQRIFKNLTRQQRLIILGQRRRRPTTC